MIRVKNCCLPVPQNLKNKKGFISILSDDLKIPFWKYACLSHFNVVYKEMIKYVIDSKWEKLFSYNEPKEIDKYFIFMMSTPVYVYDNEEIIHV